MHPRPPDRPPTNQSHDATALRPRDLSDVDLITATVIGQVARNREHACQLVMYAELRRRCEQDYEQRRQRKRDPFVLTPTAETAVEIAGALGVSEHKVQLDLVLHDRLTSWFPKMWQRCLTGRLDLGRARIFVDAAEQLADPDDIPKLAEALEQYFDRYDDEGSPLCTLTYERLSRATRYRRMKFEQRSTEETFAEAFRKRSAWLRPDDNGLSTLGVNGAAHDLRACDYRLTLIAKKRCEDPDDDRTLAQMRADTMVDLILGRLTVGALDSELEDDETGAGQDPATTFAEHEVGKYAKPVVNVVVPITSLLGSSDEPGYLDGQVVPADYLRLIANDPDSTWYRLLTDPAGNFVELSTKRYTPTPAMRRTTNARDVTCVWPGCARPASEAEDDHRVPYPRGATATANLDSLCTRHHHVKHSEGYEVRREADGTYVVLTRRGSVLRSAPFEQPYEGARSSAATPDHAASIPQQRFPGIDSDRARRSADPSDREEPPAA